MTKQFKLLFMTIGMLVMTLIFSSKADAVSNGFMTVDDTAEIKAYHNASKISNSYSSQTLYGNPRYAPLKGLGLISNRSGTTSSGSAVIVDDYTIVTNKHTLSKGNGRYASPKELVFYASIQNSKPTYQSMFKIKDYILVPNHDIAILHTTKRITSYAPKAVMATETTIKRIPYKSKLQSIGYPHYSNYKPVYSKGLHLGFGRNYHTQPMKMQVYDGQSGSPVYNSKRQLVSIVTYNFSEKSRYGAVHRSGATPLTGVVRKYINRYRY